jgi:large conductance mechanosensitive channel
MLREFRQFLFRGNLIDLAVAIVIGTAFGLLVAAFVADIITPIVAAIFGSPDFSGLSFTVNGSVFRYGDFLNALITFVSVAAAVFFFVVKPMNALTAHTAKPAEDEVAMRDCPECLSTIPAAARRCSACTAQVQPVS